MLFSVSAHTSICHFLFVHQCVRNFIVFFSSQVCMNTSKTECSEDGIFVYVIVSSDKQMLCKLFFHAGETFTFVLFIYGIVLWFLLLARFFLLFSVEVEKEMREIFSDAIEISCWEIFKWSCEWWRQPLFVIWCACASIEAYSNFV